MYKFEVLAHWKSVIFLRNVKCYNRILTNKIARLGIDGEMANCVAIFLRCFSNNVLQVLQIKWNFRQMLQIADRLLVSLSKWTNTKKIVGVSNRTVKAINLYIWNTVCLYILYRFVLIPTDNLLV